MINTGTVKCFIFIAGMIAYTGADSQQDKTESTTVEVCTAETFNASCPPSRVVRVKQARYGRMSVGRCVQRNLGYLGCAVDVRAFLDSRCLGRRECSFALVEPTLIAMKPCPAELTSYLEVTYDCIRGAAMSNAFRKEDATGIRYGIMVCVAFILAVVVNQLQARI